MVRISKMAFSIFVNPSLKPFTYAQHGIAQDPIKGLKRDGETKMCSHKNLLNASNLLKIIGAIP